MSTIVPSGRSSSTTGPPLFSEDNANEAVRGSGIDLEKAERFAAAFRNAFFIANERASRNEPQDVACTKVKAITLTNQVRILEKNLDEKSMEYNRMLKELERMTTTLQDDRKQFLCQIADLEARNRKLADIRTSLQERIDTLEAELRAANFKLEQSSQRVGRLEAELGGFVDASERARWEKDSIKTAFEEAVQQHNNQLEELRCRKEKYKCEAAEERRRAIAFSKAIESFESDRAGYTETIRAQLNLLNQKTFLIESLEREISEVRAKESHHRAAAEEAESTIKILNESIQKYQDTVQEFMSDITEKDREIERLRGLVSEVRSFVDVASRPGYARASLQLNMQLSTSKSEVAQPSNLPSNSPLRPHSAGAAHGYRERSRQLRQPRITYYQSPSIAQINSKTN